MANTQRKSEPHMVRTAADFRQNSLFKLQLSRVDGVNQAIRLLKFKIVSSCSTLDWDESDNTTTALDVNEHPPFGFLPGQWLDVHIPNIRHAGGFTITSTPREAEPRPQNNSGVGFLPFPFVELAVQNSPSNPAAAWFWQPPGKIINSIVKVRVGGGFVWPPQSSIPIDQIKKVVFVAGGVGINPFMSMISHLHQIHSYSSLPMEMHLLYSIRLPVSMDNDMASPFSNVLFFDRLQAIIRSQKETEERPRLKVHLHATNLSNSGKNAEEEAVKLSSEDMTVYDRRICAGDLRRVLSDAKNEGEGGNDGTVCYVCGPPAMTDEFVEVLRDITGESIERGKRVFYEKWW